MAHNTTLPSTQQELRTLTWYMNIEVVMCNMVTQRMDEINQNRQEFKEKKMLNHNLNFASFASHPNL